MTARDEAKQAHRNAHREMRDAVAADMRRRSGTSSMTLAEHFAAAKSGEVPIVETTDLSQLAAVMFTRNVQVLDAFAQDETEESGFRANCARTGAELAIKLAEHLVNARPERDQKTPDVVVVNDDVPREEKIAILRKLARTG